MLRAWKGGRGIRGPVLDAVLAVPDRDERLPGRAARREAAGAADGPGSRLSAGRVAPAALARRGPVGDADTGRAGGAGERRPGGDRGGPRLGAARVRDGAAAPAAAAAGGADPVRRAAHARGRLGRHPRVDRRVGEQRAAAGADRARARCPSTSVRSRWSRRTRNCSRSYVDAFQRYDIKALVTLLRADALQTMPPFEMWISGAQDIAAWMVQPGPMACAGSLLVPVRANGVIGWGQYKPDPEHGGFSAVGAAGARGERRQVQPADLLPRDRAAVPVVRAAGQDLRRPLSPAPARVADPGRAWQRTVMLDLCGFSLLSRIIIRRAG